ncbi:MAG: zinc-dependent metalloprotease [Bacteroidota bacterium]
MNISSTFQKLLVINFLVMGSFSDGQTKEHELIYIPVLFHVVYHVAEENISDEQIASQLASLNRDFRKQNHDLEKVNDTFNDNIADSRIAFVFADRVQRLDVQRIIRVQTDQPVFTNSNLFATEEGGSDPIYPDRILNIWVANLADGLLGFFDDHGVAIDFKSFGTDGTATAPYHLGRTLTHELGHFFSLHHPWGVGGCDEDDGIKDTPNQASSIASCDLQSTTCGSLDMTQNFMNMVTDDCLLFFTHGQVEKMRQHIDEVLPQMTLSEEALVLSAGSRSNTIRFYPNPSKDGLYKVDKPFEELKIRVFSIKGGYLKSDRITGNLLDLSDLSNGIYFISIGNTPTNSIRKIIIE